MKILDRYILFRFLYNFFSSFVILMFIFIFQTIWLFIDDLAGKGLDIVIIGKFLFYLTPNLTEKVLPLTVLLSSILTFGTFAENYEFAAMKASGISLQKAMRSLIIFVSFLGIVTFFFANNVIPQSEQKIYNMRKNIAKIKPAAIIAEGVFSDFEGMNIKVDKKYGENDRFLDDIIIHKKHNGNINNTVIKAKTGELISDEASDIVQLVLKDGHYYEEVKSKNRKNDKNQPFAKVDFETYTINIEITSVDNQDLEKEGSVSTDKMKNVSRLVKDIDSIHKKTIKTVKAFSKNTFNRVGVFKIDYVKKNLENGKQKDTTIVKKKDSITIVKDSLAIPPANIVNLFESMQQMQLVGMALSTSKNVLSSLHSKKQEIELDYKRYNVHILSLHKKYALALSCIILFFVGAPLGAIIRKGGLGLPMVIAIILFLVYYFLGVFASNYAKEGNIHPILGAWLATLIMLPLGIFLTRRATADKGLAGVGGIIDFIKAKFKKKEKDTEN